MVSHAINTLQCLLRSSTVWTWLGFYAIIFSVVSCSPVPTDACCCPLALA